MSPAFVWALFILLLCGLPSNQFPETNLVGFDKFVHLVFYLILSLSLAIGFSKQFTFSIFKDKAIYWGCGIAIIYGITIELLQGMVFATRSIELADIVANTIGSGCGSVGFFFIYGKIKN